MKFCKMNGLGNDYVFVYLPENNDIDINRLNELAVEISDRNFAIGSDGLIIVDVSDIADCKMMVFNSDGSEAEMCGNALRCVGRLVHDRKIVNGNFVRIQTLAGIKRVNIDDSNGNIDVKAEIGKIKDLNCENTKQLEKLGYHLVDAGNPHAVKFCESLISSDMNNAKSVSESIKGGINVEYARLLDDGSIIMRVYERGSGETLACGTGATAVAYVAKKLGYVKNKATIHLLGGTLVVEFIGETAYISGRAEYNFTGEYNTQKYRSNYGKN